MQETYTGETIVAQPQSFSPNQEQVFTILRAVIQAAGSGLGTTGVIAGNWASISAGLAMVLTPLAWSLYEKTAARMAAKVDALPGVAAVITCDTPEGRALANAVPSPTVVPAGTRSAEAIIKNAPAS